MKISTKSTLAETSSVLTGIMLFHLVNNQVIYQQFLSVPVARLLTHADTGEPNNALCDAVEGLSHVGDRQSQILLNLITVLIDNSEKW